MTLLIFFSAAKAAIKAIEEKAIEEKAIEESLKSLGTGDNQPMEVTVPDEENEVEMLNNLVKTIENVTSGDGKRSDTSSNVQGDDLEEDDHDNSIDLEKQPVKPKEKVKELVIDGQKAAKGKAVNDGASEKKPKKATLGKRKFSSNSEEEEEEADESSATIRPRRAKKVPEKLTM